MEQLTLIEVLLPHKNPPFYKTLAKFLSTICKTEKDTICLPKSNTAYIPGISIKEENAGCPSVRLITRDKTIKTVELKNITGTEKRSPYEYSLIELDTVIQRIGTDTLKSIDHAGINLPWFNEGIHPEVARLRDILKEKCLYHLFPTGENWDFIIPATPSEISNREPIDYNKIRKPKFEVVSFENDSTPLIQLDVGLSLPYEKICRLFPEGIDVLSNRNVWVYLINPYGIDVCLVLNENKSGGGSNFFKDTRYGELVSG